jgi:hemerythrin-like domain-containing protein
MPATEKTDAIKLLTEDHKEVKKLFDEYKKLSEKEAPARERQALAARICSMLTVHTTVEEELFYPLAREALGKEADLIDEATVEHASAKDLIAQLQSSSADDDMYDAKVKVLGEYIDHHVKEEQDEMFPKLRKTSMDMGAIGRKLEKRRAELESAKVPAGVVKASIWERLSSFAR